MTYIRLTTLPTWRRYVHILTCTNTKVDPKIEGSNNSVIPNAHTNALNTKVSNTLCKSNNQITLYGNYYESGVGCGDTIVPSAVYQALNDEVLFKKHCSDKSKCEVISDQDKSENKSVLLFDINHSGDMGKWLNVAIPKHIQALLDGDKAFDCVLFSQWRERSEFDFGLIPLSDFRVPPNKNTILVYPPPPPPPFEAHKQNKHSGLPNFMHCKISLKSQLCINEWQTVLKGYWDTQLIDLLRFGLPLDFDRNSTLTCDNKNHTSATHVPLDAEAYLKQEGNFGAILGPFLNDPIPECHKSPFMTREKPNSLHRHVIVDLSLPKGESVNTGVKDSDWGTDFVLSLPTVAHITSCVKALGLVPIYTKLT